MKHWQIALVVILILAALFLADGGSVYLKETLSTLQPGAINSQSTTSAQSYNLAPYAAFTFRTSTRTLKYIAPTDQDLILLLNNSTDLNTPAEALESEWYIRYNGTGDWQFLNASRDYRTRLPPGEHEIELVVSNRATSAFVIQSIVVERSDTSTTFPAKNLSIPIKGINVRLDKRPSEQEIEEYLSIIQRELGCNGVKLVGGHEDVLLLAAKIAIRLGFQEVILNPRYEWTTPYNDSAHIEDHIRRIGPFASKANALLNNNTSVILCIGDELTFSVRGITNSSTYELREQEAERIGWKNLAPKENAYLKRIITEVRKNFGGKITYASPQAMFQYLDWRILDLDIIGPHLYYATEWYSQTDILNIISGLKRYGKPVYITEFGCAKYVDAGKWGGGAYDRYTDQPYSETEQARNIDLTLQLYERAHVPAVYLWVWMEYGTSIEWEARTYGVINHLHEPYTRTLGFYLYKSFELTDSLQHPSSESQSASQLMPVIAFQQPGYTVVNELALPVTSNAREARYCIECGMALDLTRKANVKKCCSLR